MRPTKRVVLATGVWLAAFLALVALMFGALTVGSVVGGWGPAAAGDRLLTSGKYAFLCLLVGWTANASAAFWARRGVGRDRA